MFHYEHPEIWTADGYERVEDGWGDWAAWGVPFRCPRCGTTRLEVAMTAAYEAAMRCPDCKVCAVVHDG